MTTDPKQVERVAIALLMIEQDWPDTITREHAARIYHAPESTGPHHGDCTNEAHTCFRCQREAVDTKARAAIAAMPAPKGIARRQEPFIEEPT